MRSPDAFSPLLTTDRPRSRRWWVLGVVGLLILLSPVGFWFATQPPSDFPANAVVQITPGSTTTTIAEQLAETGVIRSRSAFIGLAVVRSDIGNLQAGRYQFTEPHAAPTILDRLTAGDYDHGLIRLTLVEGQRVSQFATRAAEQLPGFSAAEFISAAEPYEGTLFPDTYLVPDTYTAEALLELMRNQYETVLASYETAIAASPLTKEQAIILASVLEREANTPESMRLVSGTLQNRLEIDMPLQADATIEYVLEKPLVELTPQDLERDTPYNTYLYTGLPPTPIGNPGRTAIEAALNPADTDYLYYITAPDGTFYYAEDFATHRNNIERYLRR